VAKLSHVDRKGRVRMVDVGAKPVTVREAVAHGEITMSGAALRAIRAREPKKLVGAVAVASAQAARAMQKEADAMVCLNVPAEFYAVGQFFTEFEQVSDEDVIKILESQDAVVSTGESAQRSEA